MSVVLIVDDSQSILTFLQAIFESEQYEVVTATNGIDGLAKVHQARPDVIITDSVMPELDGFRISPRAERRSGDRSCSGHHAHVG